MPKLSLKKIRLHVEIERVPSLTLYAAIGIAAACLVATAWFTYRNVYVPYTNNIVPEEKLTQKQDKLNVTGFDEVRAKLNTKQEATPSATTVDPFQDREP